MTTSMRNYKQAFVALCNIRTVTWRSHKILIYSVRCLMMFDNSHDAFFESPLFAMIDNFTTQQREWWLQFIYIYIWDFYLLRLHTSTLYRSYATIQYMACWPTKKDCPFRWWYWNVSFTKQTCNLPLIMDSLEVTAISPSLFRATHS